jgi:hypothetical protein
LLKEIDLGHENATDQAELILAKYPPPEPTAEDEAAAHAVAEAAAAAQAAKPAPEPERVQAPVPEVAQDPSPVAEAIIDLADGLALATPTPTATRAVAKPKRKDPGIFPMFELGESADETPAPAAAQTTPEPVAEETTGPAPMSEPSIVMCNEMIVQLSTLGTLDVDGMDHRDMFDAGLKTLGWIDEALADVANDDQPRFERLQGMTEEATDMIHLLRLENTDTAAIDAATILLQMKRSVHAVMVA